MKDAVLTVRLPRATRASIEALARREGRSLSQQVERLVEHSLSCPIERTGGPSTRPLANALAGTGTPGLPDFRSARREVSRSLARRSRRPA